MVRKQLPVPAQKYPIETVLDNLCKQVHHLDRRAESNNKSIIAERQADDEIIALLKENNAFLRLIANKPKKK